MSLRGIYYAMLKRKDIVRIPHGRYSLSVKFNYVLCLPNLESIDDGNGNGKDG